MRQHQADQHMHCGSSRKEGGGRGGGRERERENRAERIFEEIMAENFPNLMKNITLNMQEAQWTPSKMYSKRPTLRHITIKLSKDKESWKQQEITHHIQGILNKIISTLFITNFQVRRQWANIFKVLKKKTCQQRIQYRQNCPPKVRQK